MGHVEITLRQGMHSLLAKVNFIEVDHFVKKKSIDFHFLFGPYYISIVPFCVSLLTKLFVPSRGSSYCSLYGAHTKQYNIL